MPPEVLAQIGNPGDLKWLVFLPIIFIVLLLWTIPWKAVSLWKAARNGDIGWFIALFILNTLAILEIVYIFGFSKKKEEASAVPPTSPTPGVN